jgi:hypothetical protein
VRRRIHQRHFSAGHELLDVDEEQHAVLQRPSPVMYCVSKADEKSGAGRIYSAPSRA